MSLLMFLFQSLHRQDHHIPPEPTGVNILLDQMAQILATSFHQPREPIVSIERARKLGARNYEGIGDPEKAWSWLEGNERVFSVIGCSDE